MIKYVFFDLDETLFDFPLAERLAISGTLSRLGIEPDEKITERYSQINRQCWTDLELGKLSRERLVILRFEKLYSELGVDLSPEQTQKIYQSELSSKHPLIEGAWEMLTKLYTEYELYAVTNGLYPVQSRRIKDSGLNKFFKDCFISEKLGYSKPDRRFFEAAFATLPRFSKDEAIVIGDSLQSDILGAKNAGVRSCLYNPSSKENKTGIIPDYEIKNLSEIPGLLKEI